MLAKGKKAILISTVTIRIGEAEIADQAVEVVDRDEQRLGDEVEPAPVDQKVEAVELELLVVVIDDRYLFRAGEQPCIGRGGRAGCNVCASSR